MRLLQSATGSASAGETNACRCATSSRPSSMNIREVAHTGMSVAAQRAVERRSTSSEQARAFVPSTAGAQVSRSPRITTGSCLRASASRCSAFENSRWSTGDPKVPEALHTRWHGDVAALSP
jgi:hypothetical protein